MKENIFHIFGLKIIIRFFALKKSEILSMHMLPLKRRLIAEDRDDGIRIAQVAIASDSSKISLTMTEEVFGPPLSDKNEIAKSNSSRNLDLENLKDIGERGKASQSQDKSALGQFNRFLAKYNLPRTSDPQLLKEKLSTEIFGKFAAFLLTIAKVKYATASSYLASVRRFITEELKSEVCSNESWYRELRKKLKSEYQIDCAEHGEVLENKAEAMCVEDLSVICSGLFLMGNFKDRSLVTTQYHCLGRVSEIILLNLSSLKWNSFLECLSIDWNRIKVSRQGSFNIFVDAISWQRCPLHCLASYFLMSSFIGSPKLYPDLPQSVSQYVNELLDNVKLKILNNNNEESDGEESVDEVTLSKKQKTMTPDEHNREASSKKKKQKQAPEHSKKGTSSKKKKPQDKRSESKEPVEKLESQKKDFQEFSLQDKNYKSHSLRRGPSTHAGSNPNVQVQWIAERGGWMLDNISKVF
jgi:hypothetical protein